MLFFTKKPLFFLFVSYSSRSRLARRTLLSFGSLSVFVCMCLLHFFLHDDFFAVLFILGALITLYVRVHRHRLRVGTHNCYFLFIPSRLALLCFYPRHKFSSVIFVCHERPLQTKQHGKKEKRIKSVSERVRKKHYKDKK